MAEFRADESEELFQQVKGIPWESLIPPDGRFTVNCSTVKSKLRSEPNNQKTVKKAIVERLSQEYGIERFPETGAAYTVKVTLLKDVATITVDTSGEGLHKRGYRVKPIAAPLKETLAAALVELSFWRTGRILMDPCCGSGTIPIEAAMIGRNIAPGLKRHFASEEWDLIPEEIWQEERDRARQEMTADVMDITACDIDPKAVAAAKENAKAAGVADTIKIVRSDIKDTLGDPGKLGSSGIIISNPVYGERLGDQKQADYVFAAIHDFMAARPDWSVFLITPDKRTEEKTAGRRADRRRKLYNGNIEVCYYQFHGVKKQLG
jgi:putative N6-adenine-specific DNA methylase